MKINCNIYINYIKMNRGAIIGERCCYVIIIILIGCVISLITFCSIYVNYSVSQTEYAVGYDTYNMKFTKIYDQGKYTIKVGEEMIKIKRTLQDFNNDIKCLTKDKILIDLSVLLQYQYKKEYLIDKILEEFSSLKNFNNFLFDRITSTIIGSCLYFDTNEYYSNRTLVDNYIYNNLKTNINGYNLGVDIDYFQLINIQFPSEITNIIINKQNVNQLSLTAINERTTKLTNANTAQLEMQRRADILIINANTNANITLNQAMINSHTQEILWNNRIYTYTHANNVFKFNTSELIDYIQSNLISKSENLFSNMNF